MDRAPVSGVYERADFAYYRNPRLLIQQKCIITIFSRQQTLHIVYVIENKYENPAKSLSFRGEQGIYSPL